MKTKFGGAWPLPPLNPHSQPRSRTTAEALVLYVQSQELVAAAAVMLCIDVANNDVIESVDER